MSGTFRARRCISCGPAALDWGGFSFDERSRKEVVLLARGKFFLESGFVNAWIGSVQNPADNGKHFGADVLGRKTARFSAMNFRFPRP